MIDVNAAKLDEALNKKYQLPENVYFSTHTAIGDGGYFIMLENQSGDFLKTEEILSILDSLNSDILEKRGEFYYLSSQNANILIETISYLPLKVTTHNALCALAKILNSRLVFLQQAHCTKNKLFVPYDECYESVLIDDLESEYNLKYIGKTSSGWKSINYLIFTSLDPENLYTLLRIQGKLKEQHNN